MQVLAFEAVTRAASALALGTAGEELGYQAIAPGRAAADLPQILHDLIETHGRPQALAVAAGPGSFTGLRVAVVAARTLAWLEGLPVHPVDTLQAIAAAAGPGCWWVLLPLKKDTTFHACYRIGDDGCEVLVGPQPCADQATPPLDPAVAGATAIGPALAAKPGLAERWCPGIALGEPRDCDARGVALAARWTPAQAWDRVVPAYHIASAPELQREADRGVA